MYEFGMSMSCAKMNRENKYMHCMSGGVDIDSFEIALVGEVRENIVLT